MTKKSILIVDDDEVNLHIAAKALGGDYHLHFAKNGKDALNYLQKNHADLVLLDIMIPDMDGYEVAANIKNNIGSEIPLIFVSAVNDVDYVQKALEQGVDDYVIKPYESQILQLKVKNQLYKVFAEKIKTLIVEGIEILRPLFISGIDDFKINKLEEWVDALIRKLETSEFSPSKIVSTFCDKYEIESHSVRVAVLAIMLGRKLHFSNLQLSDLAISALLHDSGKINIDKNLLNADKVFDLEDLEKIVELPLKSVLVAKALGISKTQIIHAIEFHHEKIDGTGYPFRLEGNKIPIEAQLLSICDVFDALTTNRNYREKMSSFDALKLMNLQMHGQFDKKLMAQFISLLH